MKIKWEDHPYNSKNGGFCDDVRKLLLHPETRNAAKARIAYASERWGGTGTLFAWDVWNEIHPSFSEDSGEIFEDFIGDLSRFLRAHETKVHGRAHPQTVSMFSPHITLDAFIPGAIYRHPELDFTSTHLYEEGAIDFPKNTVDSAIRFGALVTGAVHEATPSRPYFDSEHGPIHLFLDHHKQLEEPFDDEYFRHMQWAHVSCGGAGGGMRWPYRWPHSLTPGMRKEQLSLSRFVELIDWKRFDRKVLSIEVPDFAAFACAGSDQAVAYVIRKDSIGEDGMLLEDATPREAKLEIPGLNPGCYEVICWNTAQGVEAAKVRACVKPGSPLQFTTPPITTDMSFAVRRVSFSLREA
jgi:mannan endo-1,4-beta-mannosidase